MKNHNTLFAIFLIVCTTFKPLFLQLQIGPDIEGEAGHVRVYELNTSTSVHAGIANQLKIYPNPTTGLVELSGIKTGRVSIIDNYDKIIWNGAIRETPFYLSALPNGLYFIQVVVDNKFITQPLVKQ